MHTLAQLPGLLAAWDGMGFMIFFVVAFFSWLINFLGQQKAGVPKQRRPPIPGQNQRRDVVQSEIDKFLQQARELAEKSNEPQRPRGDIEVVELPQNRPDRQQRRPAPPAQKRRSQKEIWDNQIGKRAPEPQSRTAAKRQQPQPQTPPARQSGTARPSESISSRHMQTTIDQASVSRDLGRLATGRISDAVQKDLSSQVDNAVTSHLGTFQAGLSTSAGQQAMDSTLLHKETAASRLIQLMRSRRQVRDAMIVSEVLAKPLALRRSRS
ncbi:hypothetical protein [Planctomicrobium piriforme]|uniref:Uncharacterized protein n=1 Tax=Planctomicrobium piriforme TaxID=1576369 RepID=A0A1I3F0N6_9PLAN|nr:hypothetical protein [Planctomicrobium piriforme]SFI04766.1 hypothetical protein SAMN05421753_10525 [Planctomicrobium piriforme]